MAVNEIVEDDFVSFSVYERTAVETAMTLCSFTSDILRKFLKCRFYTFARDDFLRCETVLS